MDVRVRRGLLGLAVLILLWLLVAVFQLVRVSGDVLDARSDLDAVEDAVRENDVTTAADSLDDASSAFGSARRRLEGAALLPMRLIPVVSRHLKVLRHMSASGEAAADAGHLVAAAVAALPGGLEALAPSGGGLPIEAYAALAEPVRHADALLARSARTAEQAAGMPVVAPLDDARRQLLDLVPAASDALHRTAIMLPVLDELLGGDKPRRYLFLAQNPAEIRGTGGFIGAYSILTMNEGRFEFDDFDEIQELPAYRPGQVGAPSAEFAARYDKYGGAGFWHNINMTPDFPTAARAMETLYAKGTGDRVDGVIAVDPFALEALLKIAGPVEVPGFGLVGDEDVVDVLSNRAHHEIRDSDRRKALLGAVAVGAFEGFLHADGAGRPLKTAQTLMGVMRDGHLLLRSSDPDIQAALVASGVAGALLDPPGDFTAVVANAGSAAKLDYYMERAIAYDVELRPDGSAAALLTTTFRNEAPTSGISARVIGPNLDGLEAGEQRLVVSMYASDEAVVDSFSRTSGDRPVLVGAELGHTVFETVVEIPGGDSQTLTVSWETPSGWEPEPGGGRYRLTVQGQPTLRPTTARIDVAVPPGMEVTALSPGLEQPAAGRVRYRGTLGAKLELQVAFGPPGGNGFLGRLRRWWFEPVTAG